MYCKKCGNKLSEDTQFCPKCGTKIINDGEKNRVSFETRETKRKNRIKCMNCRYVGSGLKGRSIWATILVWVIIPFAPIITIIYYLVSHKWLCPKCKSKFVEEIDEQGKIIKRRNIILIIVLILVGVAFIGILASIVLVNVNAARTKARDAMRKSEMAQIQVVLELYFNDNRSYPEISSGSYSWINLGQYLRNYLSPLPKDPLNEHPCVYNYYSDGTYYTIEYCEESGGKIIKQITSY